MTGISLKNRIRAVLSGPFRRRLRRRRSRFLRAAASGCQIAQHRVLREILRLNADTGFARDHGLRPGMSIADFRQQVPVAGYERAAPYIEQVRQGRHQALLGKKNRLLMFAISSGTTAAAKLIPITRRFVRDYRRGWQSWAIGLYAAHPLLQQLNIIQITSSHRRFTAADGTPCGNISGLVSAMQSRVVRSMYSVPPEVADLTDPVLKRYLLLRFAVADPMVGLLITANPGTLLQLAELLDNAADLLIRSIHDGGIAGFPCGSEIPPRLRSLVRPDRVRSRQLDCLLKQHGRLTPHVVWPWLTALGVWCGGSAATFLPELRRHFPGVPIRDHGLHASEGRMTLPIQDETSTGILEILTHYFEFIPTTDANSAQPLVLEAHELTVGGEYLILMTTCSGLYRYNIHDVVRCTGFHGQTPMLEFLHKGAHISNITGEKISESQVVAAVQSAARTVGIRLSQFTMTPRWGTPPGYNLFLDETARECRLPDSAVTEQLAEQVDRCLRLNNGEYNEKRHTGRLARTECVLLPPREWQEFRHQRLSGSGGSSEQYKHPCLLPDPRFERLFEQSCGMPAGLQAAPLTERRYEAEP